MLRAAEADVVSGAYVSYEDYITISKFARTVLSERRISEEAEFQIGMSNLVRWVMEVLISEFKII